MSTFNFGVNSGEAIRLKTAGKYCDRDIVVSGIGGGGGRNPLELLYTEGAEITAEDWGDKDVTFCGTSRQDVGVVLKGTSLKTIKFPNTQIRHIGLHNNVNLESYDSGINMIADTTATFMFYACSNLKKIWMGEDFLPFANHAFSNCHSLNEVHYRGTIDKWATAPRNGNYNRAAPFGYSGGGSFYLGDSAEPLTEINLTTATSVQGGAFYNFKDVIKAHLGASVASIGAAALQGCIALDALILEGDAVKTLSNVNAFTGTPIASGTGVIYIKPITADEATLVAEYQAATNWSTYEAQIKPYSEYTGGAE